MTKFSQSKDGVERCNINFTLRLTHEEYEMLTNLKKEGIDWRKELRSSLTHGFIELKDMVELDMNELRIRHDVENQYSADQTQKNEEQYLNYIDIQVHCPDCAGQGKLPCPECGGHGRSSFTADGMCPVCFGRRHMNCLTCHGDGYVLEQVSDK